MDQPTISEKSSKTIAILLIGIAALLVININANRRISRLETQIQNISNNQVSSFHDVQHTRSMLWNIESQLNELGDQIERGTRPSFDESIVIQTYHAQAASADIAIAFNLRQHNPADTVNITARSQTGQTHNAVATTTGDGHFTAAMTLPVQDNYVLTFTTSGDTITTGELMQFNLANQLCNRFVFHMSQSSSFGPNQPVTISLHPHFKNYTHGNPALNATSIVLYVETEDGDIITSWDLTPYLQISDSGQTLETFWGWEHDFSLTVGDEAGSINHTGFTNTRLAITDGLGIRYEQVDMLALPGQFGNFRGRGAQAIAPEPVREFAWRAGDTTVSWGRITIVE